MASFKLLRQWKIHAAPSIWDKKNSFQGYRTFESLFGTENMGSIMELFLVDMYRNQNRL